MAPRTPDMLTDLFQLTYAFLQLCAFEHGRAFALAYTQL